MNTTIQPGMHPDPEILNAFAEQLLSAAEREQVLAHMAACSRCREVVFLAQHAAAEDLPAPVAVPANASKEARHSWFAGWRWAWVPATAFAGFIGFAVVQHYRHAAPEMQMAGNLAQTRSQVNPGSMPAASATKPAEEKKPESGWRAAPRAIPVPDAQKDARESLDVLKEPSGRDSTIATNEPLTITGGVAGGSVHGTLGRGAAVDGPSAANQYQQQTANQVQQLGAISQQESLQAAQSQKYDDANKPAAKALPAASSETVTVEAQTPAAAPQPARQLSLSPVATQSIEVSSSKTADLKKAKQLSLPGGLGVLSSASGAGRTVAIDSSGALFLTQDNGKHWQPIPTQWTGRAVLVRARPVPADSAGVTLVQDAHFELVNDKLQTWVSADGKTWTEEPLPPK